MNQYKTLIILDWDDTLFPTSWVLKNKINVSDKMQQNNYMQTFVDLDNILYAFLAKSIVFGTVIIVTNAAKKWVYMSAVLLPKTLRLLNEHKIIVISARDLNQQKYPKMMAIWKSIVFKKLVDDYFVDNTPQNIISIGDAEYELNATIDLFDNKAYVKHKLLKTVKLLKEPNYDIIIDQLIILQKTIPVIVRKQKHLDLQIEAL